MEGVVMQPGSKNDEKIRLHYRKTRQGNMSCRVFWNVYASSESQSDEHLHKRNHQPHNRCNKRTQNPGQHKQQDNPRPIGFDFAE